MRKSLFVAVLAILAFANEASAADYGYGAPVRPAMTSPWQGFYAGVNLGYQWSGVSNASANPSGVLGGVQAGYNQQYGQFVFGGETDLQLTGADDKFAAWKFSNPWFGTLRARGGVTMNNMLFYGTVGLAYGGLKAETIGPGVTETHVSTGWTAGVGAEIGIMGNWSARVEYLYVDLSDRSFVLTGMSHGIDSNIVRIGVNYHF